MKKSKKGLLLGVLLASSLVTFGCVQEQQTPTEPVVEPTQPIKDEYAAPTYEWSKDYSQCTATRVCATDGAKTEIEIVDTVLEVIEEPTLVTGGKNKYTATFTNPVFTKQEKSDIIKSNILNLYSFKR